LLIVEDEALIRFGLTPDLEDAGYSVVEAGNADEAVTILVENPSIRLVITDLDMPRSMNGLGLERHIAASHADLPVIFISGKTAAAAKLRTDRTHFPPRPLQTCDLIRSIQELTSPNT